MIEKFGNLEPATLFKYQDDLYWVIRVGDYLMGVCLESNKVFPGFAIDIDYDCEVEIVPMRIVTKSIRRIKKKS